MLPKQYQEHLKNFAPFSGSEHHAFTLNGKKGAVLLVHGFPGTPAELRPLGNALHAAGWTVHAPLLPGFGANIEEIFEHSHSEWIASISTALCELQRDHQPVLLLGHSMGGGIAINAAAQCQPDALMLLAPFWKLPLDIPALDLLWPILRIVVQNTKPFKSLDFNKPEIREGVHNFAPGLDVDDPQVQAEIRKLVIPTQIFDELRGVGVDAYKNAPQVHMPTLVLQGDVDPVVLPHNTRALIQRLAGPLSYQEIPAEHELPYADRASWGQVKNSVLHFAAQFQNPSTT